MLCSSMAKWIFVLCVLTFSEIGCGEISHHYDDHTLVRLYPENMKQLEVIKHVGISKNMDVLKYSRGLNDSTDLLVPGEKMRIIQEMIDAEHLEYDTKEHYGRLFDSVNRVPKRRSGSSFSVYEYHSYNAIRDHLEVLAKKYPDLMSLQTLGTSFQGRRMNLVKISTNPNASNPIIFVDAGIHAREWVAPAMAVYLIQRLVSDPSARSELAGLDWYILPVVNPDGYEYTRTSKANRLWRKTRSKPSGYDCFGVDGNRNYDYKWAVSGVSNNPCDGETYAGPKPFSELETQMVRNVMMENKKRLKLYVSLHSYGNYLVYPWGYTGDILPKEWRRLDTLAKNVAGAIYRAGGDHLTVMSAGKWYPAAGGSDDYAFGAVGVPYSYTMELTKGYEFIFPERLLKEVLPQYYIGFRVFANQIKKEFSNGVRREKGCSVLGTYLPVYEAKCGCKFMRECYKSMLDHLQSAEEEACVENVPVSTATVTVFLHALHKHCGDVIQVKKSGVSYEERTLYEVVINGSTWGNRSRSVVIVDAGQDANEAPVGFALYLIEQLVACSEYRGMVEHVRWVILPSTNPDGLEYSRTKREYWRKNTRLINDLSYGVDITRNFEVAWSDCSNSTNSFSQEFPGPEATSENETIFIKNIIQNYSELTRAYISFRRDGHGIFYPLASENSSDNGTEIAKEIAGYIASKVNHEMFLHLFQNDSIYNVNARPHCGHSVDYVFKTFAIPCAFEMRMFLESSHEIMSKLHRMPKGYVSSLRAQYFNGIKELYKHIRKTS